MPDNEESRSEYQNGHARNERKAKYCVYRIGLLRLITKERLRAN